MATPLRFTEQRQLTLTTVPFLSYQIRNTFSNGTRVYSGLFMDIINVMAEFINFNYTITEPEDGEFGRRGENGTWSGMIGQLVREEVDVAVAPFVFTPSRGRDVTFLTPIEEAEHSFIVGIPTENTLTLYLRPFQRSAWALFWILGLVVAVSTHVFQRLPIRTPDRGCVPYYFNTLGYIFQQGSPKTPNKVSVRILHASYWFILITIVGTYTGNLIAFMTVRKLKLPVDSLGELAARPDFEAGPYGGGTALDIFKSANSGVYKRVWDENIKSMENVFDMRDYRTALKRARKEHFVVLGEVMSLRHFLQDDTACDLMLSKSRFFKSHIGIAARKNFPYVDAFNQRIMVMLEAGLVQQFKKKYISDGNHCLNKLSTVVHHKTSMPHALGAFMALAFGLILAVCSFVVEICISRGRKMLSDVC